ncbi:MAG TPA: hypothetical protein VFX22_02955, partial [Candidatus Kapabacteria bacterium]|nr:hypothetical protein [Candidatus Kapabacteria bacterium]
VHPDPDRALSDGAQSLTFELFEEMMGELVRVADAVNRPLLVERYGRTIAKVESEKVESEKVQTEK